MISQITDKILLLKIYGVPYIKKARINVLYFTLVEMSFKMLDNFSEVSDFYAMHRPAYPSEMYEFILAHLLERKAAWDSATGSGQVAGVLSDYFDEVYANDISSRQISFAPVKSNIQYFTAPSEDTGLPSDKFNLITVAQAIHWFNFDKFYAEVKRTARNNALIAVIGYGLCRISEEIDALIDNFDKYTFDNYFTLTGNI